MASEFNHHIFPAQKVVIKSADHLSETIFNHHLLITMGPCLRKTTNTKEAAVGCLPPDLVSKHVKTE